MRSFYEAHRAFCVTERMFFYLLLIVAVATGLSLLSKLNNRFLATVPDFGGTITEGIVGVPRFVNPVLALSEPDRDLVSLVFSGLIKTTPDGKTVNDLSNEYIISEDGRTYTFTLKDNVYFHDGEPITADDVEFTIERIQDPAVKSPKRPIWDSVLIKKIDSRRISFTLKQPYAPFIDNFTVGIIPRHIWKDVPADEFSFSEFNIDALGSGPYEIKKVERNSYGLPTYYALQAFNKYSLGKPFIKNITLNFYQNETDLFKAFGGDKINSMSGISPENLKGLAAPKSKIVTSTLPRIFGVFFNQNQTAVFLNKEVREALSVAVDKERIVKDVLFGYAAVIDSPVPATNRSAISPEDSEQNSDRLAEDFGTPTRTEQALTILSKAGWALNPKTGIMEKKKGNNTTTLSFSLATGDATELKRAAELIKNDWEKIGASVDLKIFEVGDLNQNVIRPRKFDSLFFGEIIGREFDLYPFWHSSQRNDPGLNIALYANISADKILENLRLTQNRDKRVVKAKEFETLLKTDTPAAFIYSPDFIYVIPEKLQNVRLGELSNPGERFLNVHEWYIETNKVWKFFTE